MRTSSLTVEFVGNDAHRTGEIVMDVTAGFWTSLGALVLLSMLLGAVITVVDSVLSTIQASGIIKKIPIVGTNWNLIVAIAMMAVIDIDVVGGWGVGSDSWDQWMVIVANGAIIYSIIPLKDAIISMVNKGFRM